MTHLSYRESSSMANTDETVVDNTNPDQTEAKPVEEKAATPPSPKKVTAAPPAQTKASPSSIGTDVVNRLSETLDNYRAILNKAVLPPAELERAARTFLNAVDILLDRRNADVVNRLSGKFLAFHRQEKDGLMRENYALRGAQNLSAVEQERLKLVYALFRTKIAGTYEQPTPEMVRGFLKAAPTNIGAITSWLSTAN